MQLMWNVENEYCHIPRTPMTMLSVSEGNYIKVQMKWVFFIPEFERAAKIRKIAVYRFLISLLVPEL